ncbi:MAG: tetratricopeptide repeat protein [Anaerolineales bacterium]|nr:tetratricopeptide repeat protein [Anaerolineales bacterium]
MAGNRAQYQEAVKRAHLYTAQKEWKKSITVLRVAIREFPTAYEPYALLGQACSGLKQWDRALECYKLAARYSRGQIEYLNKVADMQERLGQLDEAGRTYMAAGELLLRKNDVDGAVSNWQRAVRLEPGLLSAHRRLAMMFQRKNNVKAAVREYLAIARILEMRGERQNALKMCHAAMRLDPDNEDILKAIELIQLGEDALREVEEEIEEPVVEPEPEDEDDSLIATVRQMAAVLEAERQQALQTRPKAGPKDPVEVARRLAQDQLAEEIFRDEEDEADLYGAGQTGLSKLERDALIGQGIDFQARGQLQDAIGCYEKAVKGGLSLPAAYFTLGLLYLDMGRTEEGQRMLAVAAEASAYRDAVVAALSQ